MNGIVCVDEVVVYSGFQRDLDCFLSYLAAKGRKETTIHTYREAMKSVYRTMRAIGLDIDVRLLTEDDIVQIKESMTVCESSKKLYLTVLGRFLEVLGCENKVKSADILWNRTDVRRLFITPDEFRVLMATCDARERLALALGAYMGLRRSEIIGLRFSDMHGNIFTIHGKGHGAGGKVAHIKAPKPVLNFLKAYLRVRPKVVCDHVLLTLDGRRMTSEGLGRLIKRAGRRCSVELTPHSLRRLFACTLNDVGTDLDTIRRLMRHESVTTTVTCYLNANPVKSNNAVEALCMALA